MKLKGQVAIITGATSGIGRATSKLLGENGATIVAFGTNPIRGHQLEKDLESHGIRCLFFQVDVRSSQEISKALSIIQTQLKRVDILVNNAGIRPRAPLVGMSEEDWDRTFDINVKGIFLLSRAVIPMMEKSGRATIINIASELALVGHVGFSAYAASKAAIVNLTKTMAIECAPMGIRVNCISPGPVDTPMLWSDRKDTPEARGSPYPFVNRCSVLHRPDEIAQTVLFLA